MCGESCDLVYNQIAVTVDCDKEDCNECETLKDNERVKTALENCFCGLCHYICNKTICQDCFNEHNDTELWLEFSNDELSEVIPACTDTEDVCSENAPVILTLSHEREICYYCNKLN